MPWQSQMVKCLDHSCCVKLWVQVHSCTAQHASPAFCCMIRRRTHAAHAAQALVKVAHVRIVCQVAVGCQVRALPVVWLSLIALLEPGQCIRTRRR